MENRLKDFAKKMQRFDRHGKDRVFDDLLTLAIQFCLREERIHGNPIGSLNVAQLEANVRAACTPLLEGVWERFGEQFFRGAGQ